MREPPDVTTSYATTDPTGDSPVPGSGLVSRAYLGDELTVVLTGEVDLALSGALAQILVEVPRHRPPAVVDASAVTFADGTLLGFLVAMSQLTRLVLKPSSAVHDLMRVAGVPSGFGMDH